MREPIYKAVCVPFRLFWAPAKVAGANMAVQFSLMLMWTVITGNSIMPFIISVPLAHMMIAIWGKREPHLSNILVSWDVPVPDRPKIFIIPGERNLPLKQ